MKDNKIDLTIIEKYCNKLGRPSNKKLLLLTNSDKEYLLCRFNDSDSIMETIWRIKNNIEIKPTCKYCGKILSYPFKEYCSKKCMLLNTGKSRNQHSQQTKLERYGDKNYNNTLKGQQTCLQKYGVKFAWNNENQKQTCIKKYGVDNVAKSEIIKEKIKQTNKEKYGVEYFYNY